MKVKTSVRTTPAAIEYLLYSGIIFQTALVALTYKQIGRTARLFPGAFAYLVGAYFSILALAIVQLNRVHRERKRARLERERPAEQEKSGAPENVLQPEVVQPELVQPELVQPELVQPMVAEAPVMAL